MEKNIYVIRSDMCQVCERNTASCQSEPKGERDREHFNEMINLKMALYTNTTNIRCIPNDPCA